MSSNSAQFSICSAAPNTFNAPGVPPPFMDNKSLDATTFNKMTLLCEAALKTKRFIHPGPCSSLPAPPRAVFLYFYTSAPSYESPLLEIIDTERLSRRHLLIVQLQHNLLVCSTTELLSHHSVCDTNCQQQEAQTIASIQFGLIQRQQNTHTQMLFEIVCILSLWRSYWIPGVIFSSRVRNYRRYNECTPYGIVCFGKSLRYTIAYYIIFHLFRPYERWIQFYRSILFSPSFCSLALSFSREL